MNVKFVFHLLNTLCVSGALPSLSPVLQVRCSYPLLQMRLREHILKVTVNFPLSLEEKYVPDDLNDKGSTRILSHRAFI